MIPCRSAPQAIARFPKRRQAAGTLDQRRLKYAYDLLASDNPSALEEFALQWSDLMKVQTSFVVEDKDLIEVLKRGDH
jgi:hypothetical protein